MSTEENQPSLGKPWTVVKTFDTFEEANTFRLTLLEEWKETGNTDMSIKVKLKSKGFTVRTRSNLEPVVSKKTKTKKKKRNKDGKDSGPDKANSD
jgi:hypothetical protein